MFCIAWFSENFVRKAAIISSERTKRVYFFNLVFQSFIVSLWSQAVFQTTLISLQLQRYAIFFAERSSHWVLSKSISNIIRFGSDRKNGTVSLLKNSSS